MLRAYKKRLLVVLIILLMLFVIAFFLALINLKKGIAVFNIGLSYTIENWGLIILSILAMIKTVHEIIKVEH